MGVLVPHILSGADVKRALAAMRFMPNGTRGKSGVSRASGVGPSRLGDV